MTAPQADQTVEKESSRSGSAGTLDASDHDTDQYLTFIMADEEYGVDILCVQEIRGWEKVTPLPNSPAHIKGVINLRGTIVPIVDLRKCFGMDSIEYTPVTVVIVLKVVNETGSIVMGIVVDAVSDVYTLADEDMRSAPDLGSSVNTDSIKGLAEVDEKMVILLNIDKLLSVEDLASISGMNKDSKSNAESI